MTIILLLDKKQTVHIRQKAQIPPKNNHFRGPIKDVHFFFWQVKEQTKIFSLKDKVLLL